MTRALELWTEAPRSIFGLPPVELAAGFPADMTLIRTDEEWTVDPNEFESKGRNTPFGGARLIGRVLATICGGRMTHARAELALPALQSASAALTRDRRCRGSS